MFPYRSAQRSLRIRRVFQISIPLWEVSFYRDRSQGGPVDRPVRVLLPVETEAAWRP